MFMGTQFSVPPHAQQYSVVLIKARCNGPFLLQRRPRAKGVLYPGRIGLFGGRREGEESPAETAIREVYEEASLSLQPGQIQLLARILAYDESGNLSFGHIFFADNLEERTLRRLKILDGRRVLLSPRQLGRYCAQMTSITTYALQAYFDGRQGRS